MFRKVFYFLSLHNIYHSNSSSASRYGISVRMYIYKYNGHGMWQHNIVFVLSLDVALGVPLESLVLALLGGNHILIPILIHTAHDRRHRQTALLDHIKSLVQRSLAVVVLFARQVQELRAVFQQVLAEPDLSTSHCHTNNIQLHGVCMSRVPLPFIVIVCTLCTYVEVTGDRDGHVSSASAEC